MPRRRRRDRQAGAVAGAVGSHDETGVESRGVVHARGMADVMPSHRRASARGCRGRVIPPGRYAVPIVVRRVEMPKDIGNMSAADTVLSSSRLSRHGWRGYSG